MEVWVKTDVATEPVTSAEAKLWAKIPSTADDSIVTMLITSAREAMEKYTNTSCASKTLIAEWDGMPEEKVFKLPYGPISSITSVKTVDDEGTETALTLNTEYWVYGTIWKQVEIGKIWPGDVTRIKIEYVAGYGATNCPALPGELKECILKEIATSYFNRENHNVENIGGELSNSSKMKAAPYRREVWFV